MLWKKTHEVWVYVRARHFWAFGVTLSLIYAIVSPNKQLQANLHGVSDQSGDSGDGTDGSLGGAVAVVGGAARVEVAEDGAGGFGGAGSGDGGAVTSGVGVRLASVVQGTAVIWFEGVGP